jgi:hypothetical protein
VFRFGTVDKSTLRPKAGTGTHMSAVNQTRTRIAAGCNEILMLEKAPRVVARCRIGLFVPENPQKSFSGYMMFCLAIASSPTPVRKM